jgi:AcrR family transcriptional regulator
LEGTAAPVARSAGGRYRLAADEMLDAACSVFAAEGFANANMETIAARAGTTKPTLYARFGSKERLFATVVRREHALLTDWVTSQYQAGVGEPFHQRLHRWIATYFEFVRERPDGFRLTFEGERHAAAAAAVEEATDDRIARVARLVGSVTGRPVDTGSLVVAASVVGMLRWCAREAVRHPDVDLIEVATLAESMVYGAMRGLDLGVMDSISQPGNASAELPPAASHQPVP